MARKVPSKGVASDVPTLRWFTGMMIASVFSLVYLFTPLYMITAVACLVLRFPSTTWSFLIASPLILSMLFKPIPSKWLLRHMTPVLDYFDYEQIVETSPIDGRKEMLENGKNFILAVQPHGVIPFVSICSAVYNPPEFQCDLQTAVASVLLHTPILKHVMGIFGLIDASKHNLKRVLKKPGVAGSLVIYVGGIAELFMSCPEEERLFLSKRKGFIKLALTEGVDVIPIYLFGNTGVLTVLKTGLLATLSRKLQVSLTYFWGKLYLPIPRDDKVSQNDIVYYGQFCLQAHHSYNCLSSQCSYFMLLVSQWVCLISPIRLMKILVRGTKSIAMK